jgi:hypothetical protein
MDSFAGKSPHRPLSPLDPSEIRLLKLYPGELDDEVRFELQHVSLAATPVHDYIALSYVWGNPEITAPILLCGEKYPVTTNLHSFLRHAQKMLLSVSQSLPSVSRRQSSLLIHTIVRRVIEDVRFCEPFPFQGDHFRSSIIQRRVLNALARMATRHSSLGGEEILDSSQDPGLDRCHLYMWIHALCINQQDLNERSQQVGRMMEIYEHASSLFVWLGEPTKYVSDITPALDLINEVRQLAQQKRSLFSEREDTSVWMSFWNMLLHQTLSIHDATHLTNFN